jgi:NADPH-dependent 2,4-dienoyl-CoA reductase/sulfur reductase-like enzyme
MTERIVVIGADAAGMSAASQARRIAGDAVEIVAFERGAYSSYSARGIPYWVAGDVDGPERLVARSPDEHRRNGTDLRMRTEVEEIDLAGGQVLAHDLATGRSFREGFDSLVIATGAVPGATAAARRGDGRGTGAAPAPSRPMWSSSASGYGQPRRSPSRPGCR